MMVVLLVTYPKNREYDKWCRSLVERRLAACINVVDVSSFYWWENRVNEDLEVLLIMKTSREKSEMLKEAVRSEHPYKVPEIVELTPTDVSKPYLAWVLEATRP